MTRIIAGVAALLFWCGAALADGGSPRIEWKGWSISTNEVYNLDLGPSNVVKGRVAFPLTQMVDGDPKTAWVYGDEGPQAGAVPKGRSPKRTRSVTLAAEQPFVADELRLMNGYNKRPDLFWRNDRIIEIEVFADNKLVKTARLSDRMGWHAIALPRRAVKSLYLNFTGIRKGSGPDNDVCVSELALFDRGRKVSLQMPQTVVYKLSACCGGTGYLLSRRGEVLASSGFGEGFDLSWSPDGRRVCGIGSVGETSKRQLWVADARTGRVTFRRSLSRHDIGGLNWRGNRVVLADSYKPRHPGDRGIFRIH